MKIDRVEIPVAVRSEVGTRASRRLRQQGMIPAVLYGRGAEAVPLTVDEATFSSLLSESAWYSTLIELQIEGMSGAEARPTVMIKEVQRELVPRRLISIDFRHTSLQERIQTTVPVIHVGESPGVKVGGVLEHILHEVTVECLPADIPDRFEADISQLEIGDSFRVRHLSTPEGVTLRAAEDDVVVLVAPPVAAEELAAEVPTEEGAVVEDVEEPELIGERESEPGES
jgi:large subunit ribosomal protein L25